MICPHCKMDLSIRNPSGHCDHLYYPDYCEYCQRVKRNEKVFEEQKQK